MLVARVASTVTSQVAVRLLPSVVVAVMVAVPTLWAVTTPFTTLATSLSLDVHTTSLLVVVSGKTVAVKVAVSVALSVTAVWSRVIVVACVATTVTSQVAVRLLPSVVVAVIVAVPTLWAVTTPSATVATLSSELLHSTPLSVVVSGSTVAVKVAVSVALRVTAVWSRVILVARVSSTVTSHVAVRLLPSVVVAVIMAVPTLWAVTTPFSTLATSLSLLLHTTSLLVVVSGRTVAVKVAVSVALSVTAVWSRVIVSASMGNTVTLQVAERFVPSVVVAVIVASPIACAVTMPFSTVAMFSSLDDHTTPLSVVVSGRTVAVKVTVSVALSVTAVWSRVMLVARVASTVTSQVAVRLLPSVVVAVMVAVPTL